MKKFVLLLVSLLMALPLFAANAPQPLDKIVAIVNDSVITQSQVDVRLTAIKQQAQATGQPLPDAQKMRQDIINQLIDEKMLMLLAQRNHMQVTDAQVDKAINNIAQHNNMTSDQLKAAVQKQGMNFTQFRSQIHDQILIQQVQQGALGASLAVNEKEISAFMQKNPSTMQAYQVQDYLIPLASNATAEQIKAAQQQAQQAMQIIQNKNAKLPNGVQSNNLGWRKISDLPGIFAAKVSTMQTSQVAGPIQAPNGWHVIKLVAVKSFGQPLTRDQARQILMQQKLEKNLKPWLAELRKSAFIKIMQ